ncbi:MAG: MFS transporter [Opitutia bacterium]
MPSPAEQPAPERFPNGPFTRYMIGEGISMTGTWMQAMAQGWVMAGLTASGLALAAVNFASGLPMLVLFRLGGMYADRYDKRHILQACQLVQIGLALALGTLIAQGNLAMWHILVAATLLGVSNSFEMPAAAAIVPELVGKAHVARAIAVDRAIFHGTRLIGPALAGYLVARLGAQWAFYLNAGSFVALMIALTTLPRRPLGTPEQEEKRQGGMGAAFQHLRQDPASLSMIAMLVTNTLFVFPVMIVLLPLYGQHVLHVDPEQMGGLMFSSGIGSVLGSVGIMFLPRRARRVALTFAVIVICAALVSLGKADSFAWAAPTLTGLALGVSTLVGLGNTVVQERSPEEIRGRVSAIAGLSFFGFLPFAGLIMGALADHFGIRQILFGSACCYAVIGCIVLVAAGSRMNEAVE